MSDTVTTRTISNRDRRIFVNLTNESDGTGESGVAKVDISGLEASNGFAAGHVSVVSIQYAVSGFNYVVLAFDHSTDDKLAVLPAGSGYFEWPEGEGNEDPQSSGGTGDILLTTDGAVDGAAYNITLEILTFA